MVNEPDDVGVGELVAVAHAALAAEILDPERAGDFTDEVNAAAVPLEGELVLAVEPRSADTVEQVYLAWMMRQKSPNTRVSYDRTFTQWCAFLDELGVDVLDAETVHLSTWQRYLEETPNERTGKPLKPASIAQRVAGISSFYDRAKRMKAIAENPADDVDRPELDPDHSDTRALTEDEARRLLATAFGLVPLAKHADMRRVADRDADMCALLMATGIRVEECCSLLVEDLGYERGQRVVYVTRKGGKRQAVALGAAAERVDRRVAGRTSGPIFTTRSGRPVSRHWVKFSIKRLAAAAAIPDPEGVSVHSLRATFATLSLDYGAGLDDLQDAMGHADPRTTRRYDKRRNRIDRSPVHVVSKQLLADRPDQRDRLF